MNAKELAEILPSALAVCARLSGARSLYAIHQWGRWQDPATVKAMSFTRPETPGHRQPPCRIPAAGYRCL